MCTLCTCPVYIKCLYNVPLLYTLCFGMSEVCLEGKLVMPFLVFNTEKEIIISCIFRLFFPFLEVLVSFSLVLICSCSCSYNTVFSVVILSSYFYSDAK